MMSLPIGFILFLAVISYSVGGGSSWALYGNFHSFVIVVVGSLAILMLSTPSAILKALATEMKGLFKETESLETLKSEFKEISATKTLARSSNDPLIRYSLSLWEQGVGKELFVVLLSQKRQELEQSGVDAIQSLRNLSKYPPALGMAGTVMGLVSLFSKLSLDNRSGIGPALALAMTATFFGLILSNGVVSPLADRLQVKHMRHRRHLANIYQLLLLINHGEAEALVDDEVIHRAAA